MSKLGVTEADRKIGKKIQQRRRELALSAAVLSERIGISQQQLSRYERGTNKINVAHLVNIAFVTVTPIGWFFIDCQPEGMPMRIEDGAPNYGLAASDDLLKRVGQHWPQMNHEQQKIIVSLLDNFT